MASRAGTDADVDALFQRPLGEFTAARNALAARLKKSGRADEAEHVKALPKPSISAWAVNQVYWQHRKAFDALLALGEQFRQAQAAQLAGKPADLRAALMARREALSDLSQHAADILRTGGHNPTPEMMRRITTTLEAISSYGTLPDAPPAGRLHDDVDPPGFEALAALVPRTGSDARDDGGPSRVLPFRQEAPASSRSRRHPAAADGATSEARKAQLAGARTAVQQAERALKEARRAAERAEAALRKAAERTKAAEREKAEAERRLDAATTEASEARQDARRVASQAEEAAQSVADAERALDKAKAELERLKE